MGAPSFFGAPSPNCHRVSSQERGVWLDAVQLFTVMQQRQLETNWRTRRAAVGCSTSPQSPVFAGEIDGEIEVEAEEAEVNPMP